MYIQIKWLIIIVIVAVAIILSVKQGDGSFAGIGCAFVALLSIIATLLVLLIF